MDSRKWTKRLVNADVNPNIGKFRTARRRRLTELNFPISGQQELPYDDTVDGQEQDPPPSY